MKKVNRISKRSQYIVMLSLVGGAVVCCVWAGTTDLARHPEINLVYRLWCLAVFILFLIYLVLHRVPRIPKEGQRPED
jgi:ACR3 family arsenite efflux pump ArsB